MKIEDLTIQEIKQGYQYDGELGLFTCLICRKVFSKGEVYRIKERFFEAEKSVQMHLELEHNDYTQILIDDQSKYNTLTGNQKQLFALFKDNISDKEIAKVLGVTISTIRQQRFIFREKAKQAKLYLAQYENVFERKSAVAEDAIMSIHDHAKMVDMRYVVTEEEKEEILHKFFVTLKPLKLKSFPPKEKKKIVILSKITEVFELGRRYSEKEVNQILLPIYDDFVTVRRYLIQYGFMDRSEDGTAYWLT